MQGCVPDRGNYRQADAGWVVCAGGQLPGLAVVSALGRPGTGCGVPHGRPAQKIVPPDKIEVAMAGVLSVVPDPRTCRDGWHEYHGTAGKGSHGDDWPRIFTGDHPAGNRPGVLDAGCGQGQQATGLARSPVAVTAVRHSAGKAGVRALVPDAPGAA